jgi:hypothetical protein
MFDQLATQPRRNQRAVLKPSGLRAQYAACMPELVKPIYAVEDPSYAVERVTIGRLLHRRI